MSKIKAPSNKSLVSKMVAQVASAPEASVPAVEAQVKPVQSQKGNIVKNLNKQAPAVKAVKVVAPVAPVSKPASAAIRAEGQGLSFGQWFALLLRAVLIRGIEVKVAADKFEDNALVAFQQGLSVKKVLKGLSAE